MQISALRERLRALGALPVHEDRILRRWACAQPQEGGRKRLENFLPGPLLHALPGLMQELSGLGRLHSQHPAADGSARLLVALADGQTVEAVLMPPGRTPGLCVSTQVGCAVGCVFCMTGQGGLLRQLGSAEIVAQVVLARSLRPVHKVVFMGMGEPAHNLDAVMEAIQLLGTGGGIGHKNLVLSTVGDARLFERLMALGPHDAKPALALSLHTSKPALREQLLPRAPRITPAELVAAGEAYARASGYPIQFQWTLIAGVNDGADEIDGIAHLLAGKYALMNLIPYNAIPGLAYQRPAGERAAEMARQLHRRGVLTKLRQSAGQDVDAGCGQLRARTQEREERAAPQPVLWSRPADVKDQSTISRS
jgi:23S rRNA (adenine2503-C2)-methyltransferase